MKERGVNPIIVKTWDLLGLSEAEYTELRSGVRTYTISDGQRELEYFFTVTGLMPAPQKGREWVRGRDPDLYNATWPQPKFANERFAEIARNHLELVPKALIAWLDKNPKVDWVMWRSGGRGNTRRLLEHHADKYLGNYTYLDLYDLMSQVPAFPSDVWRLVETKTIEPLGFVDRVEVTDPEGTAFGYDVDEAAAKAWAAGVYQQGHLFMFPAQATGRFPYSVIEYPAMGGDYLPPVQPKVTGIFASTTSHAATHPRMEIQVRNGRIVEIKGGGLYGEGMRLLQDYPGTKDLTWPGQKKPGYWWLYEAGMGTNPKYFKHPGGSGRGQQPVGAQRRRHHPLGLRRRGLDGAEEGRRVVGGDRGVRTAASAAARPLDAPAQSAADLPGAHPRSRPVGDADRARRHDGAQRRLRAGARVALRQSRRDPAPRLRARDPRHQRARQL